VLNSPFNNVHLFKKSNKYFAFDVSKYTIIKLTEKGFDVFNALQKYNNLSLVIEKMEAKYSIKEIISNYFQIISLYERGYLSEQQVSISHCSGFNKVVILVAGGCNLRCGYCFERDIPSIKKLNLMSQNTANTLLRWFFKNLQSTRAYMTLYGGEPLLNFEIVKYLIINAKVIADQNKVKFIPYIITNGTLLDQNKALWLKEYNVNIQVSVDGDAMTHDRFRVYKNFKSTHKLIINNLRNLNLIGNTYNLRAVVTRKNTQVSDIVETLKTYGTNKVSFDIVASENQDIRLDKKDWSDLIEDFSIYLNKPYKSWDTLADEVQKTIKRICRKEIVNYGCSAGISEYTIDYSGNIFDCERLFRKPLGNICCDKDIKKINSNFLKSASQKEQCNSCWAKNLCGGGCKHLFLIENNDDTPIKEYCDLKKEIIETSIYQIDNFKSMNFEQSCTYA